ncbi:hypothetical protein DFH27DRAFT_486905 [Peziza echinospora]|nr:hypothetical protein DFH27DRAFT_486905 [Peziza echinospora]
MFKPRPQPINDADELWLMNNTAFRNPLKPNEWLAEFVACFFQHNTGDKPAKDIADFLHTLGIVKGEAAERIAAKQIELFLNVIQPGRTLELQVNGPLGGTLNLGPAGTNGISSNILPFPNLVSYEGNQVITNAGKLPSGYGQLNGFETMSTVFAEPTGWGVISDIDDTIKVTKVNSRIELLKHIFTLPSEPVAGTANLYGNILDVALNRPAWFYLSASPYNLYPSISTFLKDNRYPLGTLILRDMSWQELEAFIYKSLTEHTKEYKVDRISKIHGWFPDRKMVLIGDSTQKDPEVYGEVYKKFPGWIKAIYIRQVSGVDERVEKELNSAARFEKAFAGVPKGVWRVYPDLGQIQEHLDALITAEGH